MKHRRRARVVDLFSGAGGFSLGFHAAGARIVGAVDVDEAAGATYSTNFAVLQQRATPRVFFGDDGDLEDFLLERVAPRDGGPDILIGGPPCQGFSRVGRGKLDSLSEEGFEGDPRNELYAKFIRAADFWRPSAVVMENVPGMLSVNGRNVADEAAAELASHGYRVAYGLLNAAWYGVPQYRERLFFVAIRRDLGLDPDLPAVTHDVVMPGGYVRPDRISNLPLPFIHHYELTPRRAPSLRPATTVREAVDDLPELHDHLGGTSVPRGDFRKFRRYRRNAGSTYAALMRRWPGLPRTRGVRDQAIRRTPRDYETFRQMKPGDRYPEALAIARRRFEQAREVLEHDGKAPIRGTAEYEELESKFVPPYPVEIFTDKWRKLIPTQPSWTIPAHLAKDAYSHIHYDDRQARAISIREAARLQSFPDRFSFEGNMGDCFRQIGNAVPPLLGWHLGARILELIGFPSMRPPE